jgi:hypothetical protein
LDERLKQANIDKESKLIIHDKMTKVDEIITKTIEDRAKQLEERMGGPKKK